MRMAARASLLRKRWRRDFCFCFYNRLKWKKNEEGHLITFNCALTFVEILARASDEGVNYLLADVLAGCYPAEMLLLLVLPDAVILVHC